MQKAPGLPLTEAIQFGWQTVKTYPLFVVGTMLVSICVPWVIEWGGETFLDEGIQQFGIQLICIAVSATFALGLAKIYLRFRDGDRPVFENLFDGLAHFHKYLGAAIIAWVAVFMGLILFIVPGIVFLIRLWFLAFVIVDTKAGPIEAIQQSWDISRGRTMELLGFFLLLIVLNVAGIICLGIGLLVTLPISGLALAHLYRNLKPRVAVEARIAA